MTDLEVRLCTIKERPENLRELFELTREAAKALVRVKAERDQYRALYELVRDRDFCAMSAASSAYTVHTRLAGFTSASLDDVVQLALAHIAHTRTR